MKRIISLFVLMVLMLGVMLTPAAAQEGPSGTWLGTWPYTLPPEHHLNAYATGGPNSNLGNVYRGLVELTPAFYLWASDEYIPILAESWGFVEDNTAYEITLRSDASWSNGSPITAGDVITTYALGRLAGWGQFNYIDDVEQVDDFTVRFHFINGEPSLQAERLMLKEYIVSSETYGEMAAQALALFETGAVRGDEAWTALLTQLQEFRPETLIASGPYTYSLSDVGDSFLTMSWQPNSIYSDSVQFGEIKLWAGETESTTPLVLSGEIAHSTNVYPPTTVDAFIADGLEIVTIPRGYGPAMLFNHSVYPWNIKEVRQAVAHIIDRDQSAFLTNGVGGMGTVYMAGILDSNVPTMLSADVVEGLNRYEYNLEGAAALLESVGFTRNSDGIWADADGVTLGGEWIFPQDFVDFAGATQDAIQQLNGFGFDIIARAMPWQEVPDNIRNSTFELTVWSWGAGSPLASLHFANPVQRWQTALNEDQPGLQIDLDVEWDGEMVNVDDLIRGINQGLDPEAQRQRADVVAQIFNEYMFYIPLNVILSAEPFNTSLIAGLPEAGDPILANPTGSDHFLILGILNGDLSPAQ